MTLRGRRRQEPKFSERLTIMISRETRRELERRAIENDRSMGEIARKVLDEQLVAPEVEKV